MYAGINLLVQLSPYVDKATKMKFHYYVDEIKNLQNKYSEKYNTIFNTVGLSELEKRDNIDKVANEMVAEGQFLKNEIIHLLKNVIL